MKRSEKTRKALIMHYQKYPLLQIKDIFKYIYQSTFGCEHMVSSLEASTNFIREEAKKMPPDIKPFVEPLDGAFCRVNLSYINHGLSVETLGKLFLKSAAQKTGNIKILNEKLLVARELIRENKLPFSEDEFDKECQSWKEEGYPSIHHSDDFRSQYAPSYRVILNKYVPFLPLLTKLDKIFKR